MSEEKKMDEEEIDEEDNATLRSEEVPKKSRMSSFSLKLRGLLDCCRE